MGRRLVVALGALVAGLVAASPAAAAWTRLSVHSDTSNIVVPSLFPLGATTFESAFVRTVPPNDNVIETATFGVQPGDAISPVVHRTVLGPWGNIDDPQLLPGAGGLPQLVDSGIVGTPSGLDGTFYMQRSPTGAYAAPASVATGSSDASAPGQSVLLKSGQSAFPSAGTGSLHVWVGQPTATDVDLSTYTPGTSYIPHLAFDRSGRLWLAWYVLPGSDPGKGIYMLRLDPSTAAAMPPVYHVPRSQSISNDSLSLAMACNAICHVVYKETKADDILDTGRIVSWAPGQAAPVRVTGSTTNAVTPWLSAASTPTGRIWVAWFDRTGNGTYVAKLGDANGAGGVARALGQPPHSGFGSNYAIATWPLGNDRLVVATDYIRNTSNSADVWATVARNFDVSGIPNPVVITDPNGAAVIPAKITKVRGRCLPLKLQAYKPATLLAWIYVGRRGKVRLNRRKLVKHYAGPGIQKGCIRLPVEPKGWYKARRFRLVVGFQAGFRPPKGAYTSTHSKLIKIRL